MAEFKESVIKILNSLYENISNDDSMKNDEFFTDFFNSFKEVNQHSISAINVFSKVNDDIDKSNNEISKLNLRQTSAIESKFNNTVSTVDIETQVKINNLKSKIKDYEDNTEKLIAHNKDEKLLINSTTNPFIYKHLIDKNSNIELLEHNKKEIIERYDVIVDRMTKKRNKTNSSISSSNNKYMYTYNEASNNVIKSMNEKLDATNQKIKHINELLDDLKQKFDQSSLEIEKNFNIDVITNKKIVQEEKNKIQKKYDEDRKEASENKEELDEKKNQARSQAMKEFAQSIATLNDKKDRLEYNQIMHIRENTSIYELAIFDLDQKIRHIRENTATTKEEIKADNFKINMYLKEKKRLMRALKIKLKTIKATYKEKFNSIEDEKKLYEEIKNSQIEKLNHMTDIDENTYHNKLHLFQLNYEYETSQIERKSDYDVKQFRSKYDEVKLGLAKDYKIKQTNLFQQKQNLIYEAELIQDEIELAYKLEDQVSKNNDLRLQNELSKRSIDTLLEIEKNDLLQEYNITEINSLIEKENEKYLYNEKKEFNERDRKNSLIDINLEKALIDIEHDKTIFGLDIQKIIANEEYKKIQAKATYNENISTIKSMNTYSQFQNRKKYLLSLYDLDNKIIMSHINLVYILTKRLFNIRYTISLSNQEKYTRAIQTCITQINMACKKILTLTKNIVVNVINDQIKFETGAKYDSLFSSLEAKHNSDYASLYERETNLTKTIKNYNNGIRHFYTSISSLDTNQQILDRKVAAGTIDKSQYLRDSSELKLERKRLQHNIDKNQLQIDKFKNQLSKIPRQKELLVEQYKLRQDDLEKRQQDEAKILYDSIENFTNYFQGLNSYLDRGSNFISERYESFEKSIKTISKFINYSITRSSKAITDFLTIISNLDNDVSNKYNVLLKQNNLSYFEQKLLYDRNYQKKIAKIDDMIKQENDRYSDKLKANKQKLDYTIDKFEKLKNENQNKYNQKTSQIDEKLDNKYNKFCKDSKAIKLNLLDNISSAKLNSKRLITENDINNKTLVKKYMDHKKVLEFQNDDKIKNYKFTLSLIPTEHKNQVKSIEQELDTFNKNFNTESKNMQATLNKSVKDKNREAIRYSNDIHSKIIKCNNVLSKSRKALADK